MRRFEFVGGTSAKFWMAEVVGKTFSIVFGRLGTDGQRKDKDFPTPEAATKELEKKIAEKLREGYAEVAANAAAAAPKGAKGAAAAAPKLVLPPRLQAVAPTEAGAQAAVVALQALHKTLRAKHRSYLVDVAVRRSRRALEAIAGCDPATIPALGAAVDAVMAQVVAVPAQRLPLRQALSLLLQLATPAFVRAQAQWQTAAAAAPAAHVSPALSVLASELAHLQDPELVLRLFGLLCARLDLQPAPEAAWTRRWRTLQPHLEAHLAAHGSTLRTYAQRVTTAGDKHLADRVRHLR